MLAYRHPLAELAPRDVVAYEIYNQLQIHHSDFRLPEFKAPQSGDRLKNGFQQYITRY